MCSIVCMEQKRIINSVYTPLIFTGIILIHHFFYMVCWYFLPVFVGGQNGPKSLEELKKPFSTFENSMIGN